MVDKKFAAAQNVLMFYQTFDMVCFACTLVYFGFLITYLRRAFN